MTAMFKQHQVTPAPASIKAVEESCVTCGSAHSYRQCPATDGNTFLGYQDNIQGYVSAATVNYNQGNTGYRPQSIANQNEMQATMSNQTNELKNIMASFFQINIASSSGTGSLPSNTVANLRGDLKAITTRSSISYDGPPIPPPLSPLPKVVEREPEVTKDTLQPSTENIQPPVVQIQAPFDEPVVTSKLKPSIPYPSRANKQKLHEKDNILASKFVEIFRELHIELSFADALLHMPKFASMFKSLLNNKEKLFDLAKTLGMVECSALADLGASINLMPLSWVPLIIRRPFLRTDRALIDVYGEEITLRFNDEAITFKYAQEVLGFLDSSKSGNPTPSLDLILSTSFPSLTPFEGSDFILEEIKACLINDSIPPRIDDANFDLEGDLLLIEKLLNDDPSSPLPSKELHFEKLKTIKSSIDDPPELELNNLPSHLEYAFLEGTDKLPVIISKELKDEEKVALLKVLKSHKQAIAWKISNVKGIDPSFCTHKILMEDDFKSVIQHQRRVNPKIHEVIKKEVIKFLDAGLVYPISDSLWVSPVHCVPKKGGMTVVENKDNELIPTRLVTRWCVCIDYRKTKIRPPSHALMGRLPTDVCLLAYVMLWARSKGA
ncbi:hypothetical protein Tco_1358211 [Tanacetum coccineum]